MKLKFYIKTIFFLSITALAAFLFWQKFLKESRELEIKYPIMVDLIIDGFHYQTTTKAFSVSDFLDEKGLVTYSKDLISPDLDRAIEPHAMIFITSNKKLSIKVDGETKEVNTIRRTIEKLLKDEGIRLNPFDKIEPGLRELAQDDSRVIITRIEKKNVVEKEEIEYETIIEADKKMKWKKQVVDQEGGNGLKEVEYELVYKNGDLISKTKLATKIIREAQPEIIIEGRKIEIVSTQKGLASWYAWSGQMKCASVKYPRGTWLRVTS
ncbi:MAG: G5 domain-containing protein, partial [Candidatus Moranbacteria bacterium]|nr:G5 domain-containing protein [Candidatus Moranbacteria bacterium]